MDRMNEMRGYTMNNIFKKPFLCVAPLLGVVGCSIYQTPAMNNSSMINNKESCQIIKVNEKTTTKIIKNKTKKQLQKEEKEFLILMKVFANDSIKKKIVTNLKNGNVFRGCEELFKNLSDIKGVKSAIKNVDTNQIFKDLLDKDLNPFAQEIDFFESFNIVREKILILKKVFESTAGYTKSISNTILQKGEAIIKKEKLNNKKNTTQIFPTEIKSFLVISSNLINTDKKHTSSDIDNLANMSNNTIVIFSLDDVVPVKEALKQEELKKQKNTLNSTINVTNINNNNSNFAPPSSSLNNTSSTVNKIENILFFDEEHVFKGAINVVRLCFEGGHILCDENDNMVAGFNIVGMSDNKKTTLGYWKVIFEGFYQNKKIVDETQYKISTMFPDEKTAIGLVASFVRTILDKSQPKELLTYNANASHCDLIYTNKLQKGVLTDVFYYKLFLRDSANSRFRSIVSFFPVFIISNVTAIIEDKNGSACVRFEFEDNKKTFEVPKTFCDDITTITSVNQYQKNKTLKPTFLEELEEVGNTNENKIKDKILQEFKIITEDNNVIYEKHNIANKKKASDNISSKIEWVIYLGDDFKNKKDDGNELLFDLGHYSGRLLRVIDRRSNRPPHLFETLKIK